MTLSFFDLLYAPASATIRHFSYADCPPYGADLAILVRLVARAAAPGDRARHRLGRHCGILTDLRDRRIRGNAVLTVN